MRHPILVVLFAVAGVFSIGIGIHHLKGYHSDRQAFERHVADLCVQAAERTCARNCTNGTPPSQ
jgi:peroxiredoxin